MNTATLMNCQPLKAAKNLEFEKAAALRDELKKLRETMLFEGGPGSAK